MHACVWRERITEQLEQQVVKFKGGEYHPSTVSVLEKKAVKSGH